MREITVQRKEVVGRDSKRREEVAGHGGKRLRVRWRVGDTCKSTRCETGRRSLGVGRKKTKSGGAGSGKERIQSSRVQRRGIRE
ncbi:hypothetical protein C1H46_002778 [Malus baccata]|uniref:Uncharacterized protein n=1 Tax=Malus baccata TaxID=106549 RepID=A0A540NKL0_MALBA|nr:hypothetical protein C1H46_002778 [Malus baccata]